MLGLKVIFRKSDGRLLGAQCLGEDGPAVDKRISALAMALQMGATIHDLEEAELCYAPQFGSAKDPVNFAGMVAATSSAATCPSRTGTRRTGRSSSTCASRSSSWSRTSRRGQHPASRAPRAPRRTAEGPGDPHHLPLRGARLLCDAAPPPEGVRIPGHLRRHAIARNVLIRVRRREWVGAAPARWRTDRRRIG